MKKLFLKLSLYGIITFVVLEVLVRIFHLYSETPMRYIDEYGVEKRVPNQIGTNVTGNRRQHVTDFRINENGFNTIRKEISSNNKFKIALVGDSFIEGFHQPYRNSLGQMLEANLDSIKVFEYGIGGYDMADQMHLVLAYKKEFQHVDKIILYLKFENDFERSYYEPNNERMLRSRSLFNKIRNNSKLLVYLTDLGLLQQSKKFVNTKLASIKRFSTFKGIRQNDSTEIELDRKRISNFENLIDIYGFDKAKTILLFDGRQTSKKFIDFCNDKGIEYIDFAKKFEMSKQETTLNYDAHWNSYGRELLAKVIANHMISK